MESEAVAATVDDEHPERSSRLAPSDLVDRGLHVVVDAAAGNAAEDTEGMIVGVEQHLVGLQQIGPDNESPGVTELSMGHLQLGAFIADDRRCSDQSNWKASPGSNASGTNVPRPVV